MSKIYFLLSLLPGASGAVPPADEPPELVTDRPDQTESAAVVPPGHWQLEAGALWTRDDDGGPRIDSVEAPGALLRLGLGRRTELRVGWDGLVRERARGERTLDGSGDASLGAKVAWGRPDASISKAVLLSTSLPVGSGEITSDRADPEIRLSLARDLTSTTALGVNAGFVRATERAALYTVALGTALGERLGGFVELFGELPLERGSAAHSLDGGLTWLLRPGLQLDLAAGVGLTEAAPDAFVGLGISVRRPD